MISFICQTQIATHIHKLVITIRLPKIKFYSPKGFHMEFNNCTHESNIGLQSFNKTTHHYIYKLVMLVSVTYRYVNFAEQKTRNIFKMAREFCFFAEIFRNNVIKICETKCQIFLLFLF